MTRNAKAVAPSFCTVVDFSYLPRAVALYRSLEEACPDFTLYVLCMEAGVQPLLGRLDLRHAVMLDVEKLEGVAPELRRVRGSRSRVEYCWTVKPVLCRYLLDRLPGLDALTYVDSDLVFFEDPRVVLDELGDDSIMILPHRFAPKWWGWAVDDGIFNGGWLTFRRDACSLAALAWWQERCLEWCHDRREDGKYADQHYLDDWPERFEGVRAIAHHGAGLAPWNACRYRLELRDGAPLADGRRPVFYHYQSLRLVRAPRGLRPLMLRLPGYRVMPESATLLWWAAPVYELSEREIQVFWIPYLRRLTEAFEELRAADSAFEPGITRVTSRELGLVLARRLLPPGLRRRLRQAQVAIYGSRP